MTQVPDPLERLGETMRGIQDAGYEAWRSEHPSPGRAQFLMRAAAEKQRRRRLTTRWTFGLLAFAAGLTLTVWFLSAPRDLTFSVGPERIAGAVRSFVAAPSSDALALRFSDGSRVDLRPAARARVLELRPNGARVVLETGAADVKVEPHSSAQWTIDAGPYRVEVVGTRFFVAWEAHTETFDLRLYEGEVRVYGPDLPEPRSVRRGERLRRGPADRKLAARPEAEAPEAALAELGPDRAEDQAVLEPAAARKTAARTRVPTRSPKARPAEGPRSWEAAAEAGDFTGALEQAEALGFERLCGRLSAADLMRLADVARFAHRPDRARQALTSVRRRFPGTDAAAMAAFDLGRLSTRGAAQARCQASSSWFRTYLREQPDGKMAELAHRRLEECGEPARD